MCIGDVVTQWSRLPGNSIDVLENGGKRISDNA